LRTRPKSFADFHDTSVSAEFDALLITKPARKEPVQPLTVRGYKLVCNRFAYSYDIEDKGGHWIVKVE
jgi:hypothetical protein